MMYYISSKAFVVLIVKYSRSFIKSIIFCICKFYISYTISTCSCMNMSNCMTSNESNYKEQNTKLFI